jgi:hypothetical protein
MKKEKKVKKTKKVEVRLDPELYGLIARRAELYSKGRISDYLRYCAIHMQPRKKMIA